MESSSHECIVCTDLDAIHQGCVCINTYAHPKCIYTFNQKNNRQGRLRVVCTLCDHKFGRNFIKKLNEISKDARVARAARANEQVAARRLQLENRNIPVELPPMIAIVDNNTLIRKKKIIIYGGTTIFAMTLVIIYILIAHILVNKYYTMPNKIKSNQQLVDCTAEKITCEAKSIRYTDDSIVYYYSIKNAMTTNNVDIASLFIDSVYHDCPAKLSIQCYNYKNYYAKEKNNVEKKFNSDVYVSFITFAGMLIFIVILFSAVFARGSIDSADRRAPRPGASPWTPNIT
jgi:hypothetical protein